MSKRAIAHAVVVADVAQHGKIGKASLTAHVEGRISYAKMMEAAELGMAKHRAIKLKTIRRSV